MRSFETLDVQPNQTLIEQGARGDYFYIVQEGIALVSATSPYSKQYGKQHGQHNSQHLLTQTGPELARISAGGFFGEDALLSGQRRNAAVSMPGGGRVLRGSGAQLCTLVDDLWWVLARQPQSWRSDNELLALAQNRPTAELRDWLATLSPEPRYGLLAGSDFALQDLLLLLLVHRGYSLVLREV